VGQFDTYLVEYDLPRDNRRKRFYRAIRRYLSLHDSIETSWSTMSVVVTKNETFAWYIYDQARAVGGEAHVYEARRIDHKR